MEGNVHRGFVDKLYVPWEIWWRSATAILDTHPIWSVRFSADPVLNFHEANPDGRMAVLSLLGGNRKLTMSRRVMSLRDRHYTIHQLLTAQWPEIRFRLAAERRMPLAPLESRMEEEVSNLVMTSPNGYNTPTSGERT